MKYILLICCLALQCVAANAQQLSFKDTITAYNNNRICTNGKGMLTLGAWGIANMAAGGAGYFAAKQDEWKYFHEMNFAWGAINTGIAALGLRGIGKDRAHKYNYLQAYQQYQANKRLYLINAGLDVLSVGAGVALTEIGRTSTNKKDMLTGFGRSVAIQGVFLLLFDNVMYASHARRNSKWRQLLDEIQITGSGASLMINF